MEEEEVPDLVEEVAMVMVNLMTDAKVNYDEGEI